MTTLNAWIFPGGATDRSYFSDIGHFRTEVGLAWTMATFVYLDNLAPGEDGNIFGLRRASNDAINHNLLFDDSNNQLSYNYNFGSENDAGAMSAATWYLAALTYPGTGTTVTCRLISAAGSQIGSSSGTASSNFDDGQTQQITYGAAYSGGATSLELRGRLCLPLFIRGTALSQAQLEAYAADPLNEAVALMQSLGAQVVAYFGESNADESGSGATLTLSGSVTLGSGNGPTVPDLDAGGGAITANGTISLTGFANLVTADGSSPILYSINRVASVVYIGEQSIQISGVNCGSAQPIVTITNSQTSSAGTPLPLNSWGDALVIIKNLDAQAAVGQLYLWVENREAGVNFGRKGYIAITVRADPGVSTVAVRTSLPAVNLQSGVAVNVPAGGYFYLRTAQEVRAYSRPSGALPTGLSLNTTTGLISGTVDPGASGSYSPVIRLTDNNGDFADQPMTIVVTTEAPTPKAPGSWGPRTRPQIT